MSTATDAPIRNGADAAGTEPVPAAPGAPDDALQQEVADAIAEVETRMNLLFNRAKYLWKESAAGIHPELQPSGYKLLSIIARTGSATAHHLAELLEMDKSVVSRQVRQLEEFGLIASRPDERDGRFRVLTATPAAVAAIDAVRRQNHNRLRDVLSGLEPGELAVAAKVFRCLSEV